MTDIVKRLRNDVALFSSLDWQEHVALAREAADEIERLRAEVNACADKAREFAGHYPAHSDGRNTFVFLAEWIEARKEMRDE